MHIQANGYFIRLGTSFGSNENDSKSGRPKISTMNNNNTKKVPKILTKNPNLIHRMISDIIWVLWKVFGRCTAEE